MSRLLYLVIRYNNDEDLQLEVFNSVRARNTYLIGLAVRGMAAWGRIGTDWPELEQLGDRTLSYAARADIARAWLSLYDERWSIAEREVSCDP